MGPLTTPIVGPKRCEKTLVLAQLTIDYLKRWEKTEVLARQLFVYSAGPQCGQQKLAFWPKNKASPFPFAYPAKVSFFAQYQQWAKTLQDPQINALHNHYLCQEPFPNSGILQTNAKIIQKKILKFQGENILKEISFSIFFLRTYNF